MVGLNAVRSVKLHFASAMVNNIFIMDLTK
jgi:hypothetical protein